MKKQPKVKKDNNSKTVSNLFHIIGTHLDSLMPGTKPTKESISAANASLGLIRGQATLIKLSMDACRLTGVKPDLHVLQIQDANQDPK